MLPSTDCLETLEEIAEENKEIFLEHGGEHFTFIPCLNDSEGGINVLLHVIERELKGWVSSADARPGATMTSPVLPASR